ncbi:myeloid differentiation primary response protein MyD88, partial [Mytilus galloprovincialis]
LFPEQMMCKMLNYKNTERGKFKTESPNSNGKIKSSNTSNEWKTTVIFLTWNRYFLNRRWLMKPGFKVSQKWTNTTTKLELHHTAFKFYRARSKKLIPVLIEPSVPIPQILRHVTLCDYTKNDLMEWFWDRLAKSVKAPLDPEPNRMGSSVESSSPMSIPSNSSSSLQSQTSLSPSQSLSSIENYRLTNDSIKNAQRQLSESASMSSNTSSDSGFHSSSFQSQGASSLQSNQSSFSNEYTSLSTESFPTSSSKAREKKKGTNIFGQIKAKVSGKKHNNNTSSQA